MSIPGPSPSVYFAYGSNMNLDQMAYRCPGAEVHGKAILREHRFIINSRGWASIVPQQEKNVHGVIWHLKEDHVATLDHYEDVALDLYRKKTIEVISECGQKTFPVMTYIATHTQPGKPRLPYIKSILDAAHHFSLPQDYQDELRSWRTDSF